jgi:hypothetical protein
MSNPADEIPQLQLRLREQWKDLEAAQAEKLTRLGRDAGTAHAIIAGVGVFGIASGLLGTPAGPWGGLILATLLSAAFWWERTYGRTTRERIIEAEIRRLGAELQKRAGK